MATTNIPSQTWTAGTHNVGPFIKPTGAKLISVQLATPTDWVTGTAGRTISATVTKSTGNSVTGGCGPSPNERNGVLPTIVEMDVSNDPPGTTYSGTVTLSGNVTAGLTITVA